MTVFEYNLRKLLDAEKLHIEDLKRSLGDNNGSKLYIRQRNGTYYFTKCTNRKEKGITNNSDEIEKLMRYEKSSLELKLAENNYNKLSGCLFKLKNLNDEITARHEVRFKVLEEKTGIKMPIYSQADWEWMNQAVQKNPFHTEELRYTSSSGLKVRSKSEMNIVSRLEVYKVPFIYEKELYINGRHLFPDFTIRKRDGSIVIWEHFGLMHDQEYARLAAEKITLYRQAGFVQCDNLICTYEEDISSIAAIDNIIKKFVFF